MLSLRSLIYLWYTLVLTMLPFTKTYELKYVTHKKWINKVFGNTKIIRKNTKIEI